MSTSANYPDFRTTKDIQAYESKFLDQSERICVVDLAPRWTSSRCMFECGYTTRAQGHALLDEGTPDSDFLIELGEYIMIVAPPTACEKQNREKQEISLLLRAGALGKQIQEERIDYFLERFNQSLQNITTLDELNEKVDNRSDEDFDLFSLAPYAASFDEDYIRHLLRSYKRGIISPRETSYHQDLEGNITQHYSPQYTVRSRDMFYIKVKLPWKSDFLQNNFPYSPIIFPEKKAIQDDPSHIANDPNWIKLVS